jgi:hypothetical protein
MPSRAVMLGWSLALRRPAARSRAISTEPGTTAAPVASRPLSFCPARLHRQRDTLPSRRRHRAALGRSWWSASAFTVALCTLQSLDRSFKLGALLFELLDNLVNIHPGMLTLADPASVRKDHRATSVVRSNTPCYCTASGMSLRKRNAVAAAIRSAFDSAASSSQTRRS